MWAVPLALIISGCCIYSLSPLQTYAVYLPPLSRWVIPDGFSLWGQPPPIPREGEIHMGKDIRIAVRVTAKEKEKIQAKARKYGLSSDFKAADCA